jgi:hypothetical protein
VDQLTRAFYEMAFDLAFLQKKAQEFQDFFSCIMEKRYPGGDFIRIRPWGRHGDRKNDGYLRSRRMLFQVYAPDELEARKCVAKMQEDFQGALPHWETFFDTWVFVHNARRGLPPDVLQCILKLDKAQEGIKVVPWGFEDLREEVFRLDAPDLASLLGPIPSRYDLLNVKYPELEWVLTRLAAESPPSEVDLRPPSPRKMKANALSSGVHTLLTAGMQASHRVKDLFEQHHDPRFGDRVIHTFRRKYEEIRDAGTVGDRIFLELQEFATGGLMPTPDRQAAVLTVLAYLFEACDIFERPRDDQA